MKQKHVIRVSAMCLVAASMSGRAIAGPVTVETVVGVVGGGAGNRNPVPFQGVGPCTTYGGPSNLRAFFDTSNAYPNLPAGGIAPCGYSGHVSDVVSGTGPLTTSASLAPVALGNAGSTGDFHGSAQAQATYGTLGAVAHGVITDPGGTSLSLSSSGAAGFFDDIFLVGSPRLGISVPGFVRYTFELDGSLATTGTAINYAHADLAIRQAAGPVYHIVRLDSYGGLLGTMSGVATPPGFVPGIGSIGGMGTFTTTEFPFTWGQSYELETGLMVGVNGNGDANVAAARLTGLEFFDANLNPVTDFSLTSASGTAYGPSGAPVPVPEPASLLLLGTALLGTSMKRWIAARSARE